ncbi:phenylalanine--tRNA ligase subunit alpha [Buchnera aphidicola (Formosaphis micheliae)]|uniref:phenylalanine--tRNA ligase subunit alpha n=1 Tax=Buchnera aphidicola TaxID=9 RepID=UPI0031CC6422
MLDPVKFLNLAKIDISETNTIEELNLVKIKYLGKKSVLSKCLLNLHKLSLKDKLQISVKLNQLKKDIKLLINLHKKKLIHVLSSNDKKEYDVDISLLGRRIENGAIHPITTTINIIESFFFTLGFNIVMGPEIEDDYHNFSALNISKNHPSRSEHDTFWFDTERLLRTQTSSMQIRIMKNERPPIRVIVPGKVYRNDYDSTHTPMFHQVEGLILDHVISFSNLKWIMKEFLYFFFKKKIEIRFRPSYFPFTIPSAEIDIIYNQSTWLEVLGCGMVHPNVLSNVNIDSKKYIGCAFGIGVERLAMLRYGISDLRIFFENDLRFLRQFK